MLDGYHRLLELKPSETSTISAEVAPLAERCYEALDDDFNTPIVIAHLFDACRLINQVNDHNATATQADLDELKRVFDTFLFEILGVRDETATAGADGSGDTLKPYKDAVDLLLEMRREAKKNKYWTTSDLIRDRLAAIGFDVKDTKDGFEWSLK